MCTSILILSCKEKAKSSEIQGSEVEYSLNETPPSPKTINAPDIKITPIEHATAALEWNDITIYADPCWWC